MATITMYNSINIDDAFSPIWAAVSETNGTVANTVSDPPTTWTLRTLPATTSWNSVCYGNFVLVAVGNTTNAGSSLDGTTWTARTLPTSATWRSVCWGGTRFVAIATAATSTVYSTDGISWSNGGALPNSSNWYCVAYGEGTYVAVASGTGVTVGAYSTNGGTTWSSMTMPSGDWRSVCYDGAQFVAVSYNSAVAATSPDGINWTPQTLPTTANWQSVCYGNGKFVAVAYNSSIAATSINGVDWIQRTLSASANWRAVCYGISSVQGYKMYCAIGYNSNVISYSYDGILWIADTVATSSNWSMVCFAPFEWNSADTLVIQNGAVVTVNTDQKKFWKTITVTNGKLKIENNSTSNPIGFYMGRSSAATANDITPTNGLGSVEIDGDWITVGTGDNTSNQAFTLPAIYTEYIPAIWVETVASGGVYEIWLNVTGAFGPYMKILGLDGLDLVGNGLRGNYFTQTAASGCIDIKSLTSGAVVAYSKQLTCASTTGVYPGATITGTNVPSNSVVNRVLNSTTLEINTIPTASGSGYTFTVYNPIQSQLTTTVTVGNGTNGNKVPTGCKVRVPNILISDKTAANLIGPSNLVDGYINMSNAAPLSVKQCLFGNVYVNMLQASSVYLRDVAFAYKFTLQECYAVDIDGMGTAAQPTYWYYSSKWICRDQRYSTVAPGGYTNPTAGTVIDMQYISGAVIKNWHEVSYSPRYITGSSGSYSAVYLSYSSNVTLENIRLSLLNTIRNSVYGLYVVNRVANCTFTNLEIWGSPSPLYAATSDDNLFNGIKYSLSMFDHAVSFASNHRIGYNPGTSFAPLVDNTKYYFKVRTFYNWLDRTDYYEGNQYSATAFQAGWQFPDYISVRPTESAANSVTIDWVRRAPESGTILYEIFKSATEGFTGRNNTTSLWRTATAATVTYADTAVTAGTPYYYRFRKYHTRNTLAGCSAGNGSATLTTSGSFATFYTVSDCSFDNASTTIQTIVNNFYNSAFYPGATITGTGIDTGTTIVSIDPSGQEMIISKPTLSAQTLITLTLPIQAGMAIEGTSIQYGTIVSSVESTTSLTMSNVTTGVISAATLGFQTFTESAEFACIPNAYKTATNYCFQSRVFGTTWVANNVNVGANTYQSPTDFTWGTNTSESLTATNAGGTLTQTVGGLTASVQYTASVWVRADQTAALPSGVAGSIALGTTTVGFTATNGWKRVSATFTATGTSHTFVITITTNGQIIHVADAMVNVGASPTAHINTTTTAATLNPSSTAFTAVQMWCRGPAFTGTIGNQGIKITLGTAPTGSAYSEIYMSTVSGFTPSLANRVANTYSLENVHFYLLGSNRNTLTNITKYGKAGAHSTVGIFNLLTFATYNVIKTATIDCCYQHTNTAPLINLGPAAHNNVIHDIDFGRVPNYEAEMLLSSDSTNSVTGNRIQNIRTQTYDTAVNNQMLNTIVKGMAGARAVPATTATTYDLGGTADGVLTTFTAAYGSMFYELTLASGEGMLNMVFEDFVTNKPYTVLAGTPYFSNNGRLYMYTAGDSVEITWPHKILGVSGFRKLMPKLFGADFGNVVQRLDGLKIEFATKTTGDWGAYQRATPLLLSGFSVSASEGFYLKLKLTALTFMKYGAQTNPFVVGEVIKGTTSLATATVDENYDNGSTGTLVLSSVTGSFIPTETLVRNSDSQARAPNVATNGFALGPSFTSYISNLQLFTTVDQTVKYPAVLVSLGFTNLITGSDIVIYSAGTTTVLDSVDAQSGTSWTYQYEYAPATVIDVGIFKAGYIPFYIRNYTLGSANASLPIAQVVDRAYLV